MPDLPTATFTSSNATLDAVWALCAHSGLYTSQEQFIDTPTREKGQFLWDAANESQTVMRTYGDQNLSWQGLRDMARAQARYWPTTGQVNEVYPNDDGPQNYPTFTALYPEWVWRYYLSTGDRATVTALLPTLSRLSDYLAGIIDPATGPHFRPTDVDQRRQRVRLRLQHERRYDVEHPGGQRLPSDRRDRRPCRRCADRVAPDPNAQQRSPPRSTPTWWVPTAFMSTACEVTGSRAPTRRSWPIVAALAYGVVPDAQISGVAKYVASLTSRSNPTAAWSCCGRSTPADVMPTLSASSPTRRSQDGPPSSQSGGTFTWETWTPSDLIGDSMSHGWGSSALVASKRHCSASCPRPPRRTGRPRSSRSPHPQVD